MKNIISLTMLFLLFLHTAGISQEQLTPKSGFSLDETEEHYFLFILANRPGDMPELRGEITKYIWKYHPDARLKVTQIQIEGELTNVPIIHLQAFPNKLKAMEFYQQLKRNKPDFLQMGMTLDYFPLSKSNYESILRSKSLQGYKTFFEANYLGNR